ncbi:MAG: hypothetical protein IKL20_05285 [Alistipes sp.]|nr:hypothetical protein [Alistipes sp.]
MRLWEFIKNIINTIMDGSLERVRIIRAMNENFQESYYSGGIDRLCRVSIGAGDPEFAHEMSSMWVRSGFRITIENDLGLADSEVFEISDYILQNKSFIRQLMALGFDTLIVQGKVTRRGKLFCLKSYSNLNEYMLH